MTRTPSHFLDHWPLYQRAFLARTDREVAEAISAFASSIGFRNHTYAVKYSASGKDVLAPDICQTNYANEWGDYCRTLRYPWGETLDAGVMPMLYSSPPMCWNADGDCNSTSSLATSALARTRRGMAAEFGVVSGLCAAVPTPGAQWAALMLSSDLQLDPRELGDLLLTTAYFAGCLQTAIERIAMSNGPVPELSGTEEAILQWTALGKTSWEIGRIMHLTERTVNYHIYRAAAKLGAKGRRAAASRAIALGLIRF